MCIRDRADIEVPNDAVDMDSWASSACYPRSTFYPLSDGPSTRDHRITKADFRLCSTRQSRSQAGLCLCTRQLISDQLEPTFARLRYFLGCLLYTSPSPRDRTRSRMPSSA